MAGDWPYVPLGTLTAEHDGAVAIGPFGSSMKADEYSSVGVPVIRGTNIGGSRELKGDWVFIPDTFADAMPRCVVRSGDLVFPHRGAIGEVALVPGDRDRYFMSTSFMKATLDLLKADPRFVMYYLKSDAGRAEIMRFASQVGTPGIGQPLTSLRQFSVPTPPLAIQRAIADLLWTLDDRIELNRQMAATLEEMARALYKSWFVDFDPVRAKAQGSATGLPDVTSDLFPDKFGQDGMPEGWSTTADSIGINIRQKVLPTDVAPDTTYVGLEHVEKRKLALEAFGRADDVDSQKTVFERGDLLFGKLRPYFHKVAVAPVNGICSTDILVFRPQKGIPRTYLYLAFSADGFVAKASGAQEGTRMPRADWGYMRRQSMALPSAPVLSEFDNRVAPMIDRVLAVVAEIRTLTSLRDTLLPKLISGELRIKDAEASGVAA
ncbi:restriction endonuclease subunit S [Agrobacterium tumefaciens]|uniref:restriction endonuclease subunit S n=1 Tax=Agrobacterium tumefaciens TaxID=358 RepID=UPI00224434B7|nr:restriction endonuclease subunit S [Agrobacterium tumefaciens]MCW8057494.1 restriction endonuclease subunit S [Agrobacterium tumefaciens]MCW8146775.1 restriction endonuclease subunit S [Agrobacterium tumefaciens]